MLTCLVLARLVSPYLVLSSPCLRIISQGVDTTVKNILDEVHANVVQEELLKARNKSSEAAQMRAQQSVVEVRTVLY